MVLTVCHPDRPVHERATNLCKSCYAANRRPKFLSTCHPDRPLLARGLCNACYLTKWRAGELEGHPKRSVPQPTPQQKRRSHLKNHYNLSLEDFNNLLITQNNVCALCGTGFGNEKVVVDHDHKCCPGTRSCGNCIRGILHQKCNIALGMLGDSVEGVQRALAYLGKKNTDAAFMESGTPPVAQNVICIDFDSTIYPRSELFGYPKPLEGAVNTIQRLYAQGYYIAIFTSRLSHKWYSAEGWGPDQAEPIQREYIRSILERDGIPYHEITADKIPAVHYIDDRAIEFKNNWDEISLRIGVA